jgi:hypothetical protein
VRLGLSIACGFALLLGCGGRSHGQSEGSYQLALDKLIRDDCALSGNADVFREARLRIDGNTVRVDYSLYDTKLAGAFLQGTERFVVDGSQANLNTRIGGRDCVVDLVTVHMEGNPPAPGSTAMADRFRGSLSVKLEKVPSGPCNCEMWMAYTASLAAP